MQIGLQDAEGAHQALVDRHDRTGVVELAAVVWRREDGDLVRVRVRVRGRARISVRVRVREKGEG